MKIKVLRNFVGGNPGVDFIMGKDLSEEEMDPIADQLDELAAAGLIKVEEDADDMGGSSSPSSEAPPASVLDESELEPAPAAESSPEEPIQEQAEQPSKKGKKK